MVRVGQPVEAELAPGVVPAVAEPARRASLESAGHQPSPDRHPHREQEQPVALVAELEPAQAVLGSDLLAYSSFNSFLVWIEAGEN